MSGSQAPGKRLELPGGTSHWSPPTAVQGNVYVQTYLPHMRHVPGAKGAQRNTVRMRTDKKRVFHRK